MSPINIGKVVTGGIIAGLIINISQFILNMFIVADASATAFGQLGLAPPGGAAIAIYVLMGFAAGILLVWLYAAIRPRFGAGPKTAFTAALVGWVLWYAFSTLNFLAMGAWPVNLLMLGLFWGLVELIVAVMAGARFYAEPGV